MDRVKKLLSVLLIISAALAASCEISDSDDEFYRIKVLGYLGNFDGQYSVDGEALVSLSGTVDPTNANYYIFELDLNSPESVWIQVNGTATCASVTVNVYEGTDVVVSEYDSATDTSGSGTYDDLALVIVDYDFSSTTTE